jgi:adenylate cyclase
VADIFLSYARNDREVVERLAAALRERGFEVWWDRRILAGDEFSAIIERELAAAGAVVVAWSDSGSRSNWVKDEASFAAGRGTLVATTLDANPPPMGFRQYHAIDLSTWAERQEDEALAELVNAVASRLNRTVPETAVAPPSAAPEKDAGPWIAVTPIKVRGNDPDLSDLAEELADNISSALARFSYLNVASQASAAASKQAGARYVLEGSLRRAGSSLRLSTRLTDSHDAKQVWGDSYHRDYNTDSVFDLLDDLTDHVVTAVADPYGALVRALSAPVLQRDPLSLTVYESLIRQFVYRQRVSPEDHLIARTAAEQAVKKAPGNATAWAALSLIRLEEFKHGFNVHPDSLERALQSARRATELDPNNAWAQFALSDASFFHRDIGIGRSAGLRSLELNPRDSDAMAMVGVWFAFTGEWERGLAMVNRAIRINPNHPGWYWFAVFYDHYRRGEYEQALDYIERVNMPQYFVCPQLVAATHGQLGNKAEARAALQQCYALCPFPPEEMPQLIDRWLYAQPDVRELILDGLRKAGLELSA